MCRVCLLRDKNIHIERPCDCRWPINCWTCDGVLLLQKYFSASKMSYFVYNLPSINSPFITIYTSTTIDYKLILYYVIYARWVENIILYCYGLLFYIKFKLIACDIFLPLFFFCLILR